VWNWNDASAQPVYNPSTQLIDAIKLKQNVVCMKKQRTKRTTDKNNRHKYSCSTESSRTIQSLINNKEKGSGMVVYDDEGMFYHGGHGRRHTLTRASDDSR
jgi:hypothetical protein